MHEAAAGSTAAQVGVHSLDRFVMAVPDLDEARTFYEAFGLQVDNQGERLLLKTFGSNHVWAELVPGPGKALRSIRFGIYERDLAAFRARLGASAEAIDSNTLRLHAPDGLEIELAVAPKTSPDAKASFDLPDVFAAGRGAGPRSSVSVVHPRRLAHLALFTGDVQRALNFYSEALGLRLSDRSGDVVAFMHGVHGSEHHMIALAHSDGAGLHHSSWDVATLAEVGQGAMQMASSGFTRGWGMGRHVLGSNYFHYIRDPWGSYAEYSADMDYVPQGVDWPAADHPLEDSFYQWGPPPPEDFVTNYEITRTNDSSSHSAEA